MKLGLKIGPFDYQPKLEKFPNLPAVEVFFQPDNHQKVYHKLFALLKEKRVITGLHLSPNSQQFEPNFATANQKILDYSQNLLQKTMEIASKFRFSYVVYHPGSTLVVKLNKEKTCFQIIHKTDKKKSSEIFLQNALVFAEKAKRLGVNLYCETLPARVEAVFPKGQIDRTINFDAQSINLYELEKAGSQGVRLAFDICHVMANCKSRKPKKIIEFLFAWKNRLWPYTDLLHLSTYKPPFNGTDSSDSFLPQDIREGAIPNLELCKKFLAPFRTKKSLICIPEPPDNLWEKNYSILHKLFFQQKQNQGNKLEPKVIMGKLINPTKLSLSLVNKP